MLTSSELLWSVESCGSLRPLTSIRSGLARNLGTRITVATFVSNSIFSVIYISSILYIP